MLNNTYYIWLVFRRTKLTYRQNLKYRPMPDKMAGKLVASNIASARNQWYLNDSVFWEVQMTVYIMA